MGLSTIKIEYQKFLFSCSTPLTQDVARLLRLWSLKTPNSRLSPLLSATTIWVVSSKSTPSSGCCLAVVRFHLWSCCMTGPWSCLREKEFKRDMLTNPVSRSISCIHTFINHFYTDIKSLVFLISLFLSCLVEVKISTASFEIAFQIRKKDFWNC